MSKTKIISIAILLVGLIGFSLYLNRDYFRGEGIQITHRLSPWMRDRRPNTRANDLGVPVTFMLNGFYKLTSVRVFEAAKIATNTYAVPVWRIISDSNSVPTSTFNYGGFIKGMHPEAKGTRPEALQPGIPYRLVVVTDQKLEAHHDFTVTANN